MSKESTRIEITVVVPPIDVTILGCNVEILEVNRYTTLDNRTRYLVTCRIVCGNKVSQVFTLDVKDNRELVNKLEAEVSRFKIYHLCKS